MINQVIFLVDENKNRRNQLKQIIVDYPVIESQRLEKMWQLLKNGIVPDCIIINISMSDGAGLQAINQLCLLPGFREIPVIFLTDNNNESDVKKGFSIGCADYIKQPFNAVEVKARVSAVLNRQAHIHDLKKQISFDSLTGILNRCAFIEKVHSKIDYHQRNHIPYSIAMIDLDDFKAVNDTCGHPAGDVVLKRFAKQCSENLRKDDFCARYGGEEFIIFFSNTNRYNAAVILSRIKNILLQNPILVDKHRLKISFSAGISDSTEITDKADILQNMVSIADKKLYIAKKKGKNRVSISFTDALMMVA